MRLHQSLPTLLLALSCLCTNAPPLMAQSIYHPGSVGPAGPAGPVGGTDKQVIYNKSGAAAGSSSLTYYDTPLPAPVAGPAVVTGGGAAGVTTRYYSYTPVGGIGFGLSSPLTTFTTSNAVLSVTNFNTVTTAAVAGSTSCDVFGEPDFVGNPSGNFNYLGNVACGSSINDIGQGQVTKPASGSTGLNVQTDESAGVNINQNLSVAGSVNSGCVTPGYTTFPTSGVSQMSVCQTLQGAFSPISDPVLLSLNWILDPTSSQAIGINQPWMIFGLMTVPSTNVSAIPALEGAQINVTDSAGVGGTIAGADGVWVNMSFGDNVTSSGPVNNSIFNGMRVDSSVKNNFENLTGYRSLITANGTTGTVNRMDGFRNYLPNIGGNQGTAVTRLYGFTADAPSTAGIVNYEAFRAEDGHSFGTTTSYAFHQVGAAWKSRFEGQIQTGSVLNIGTKYTATGCSLSATAGGATSGEFTSGTSGTCTVVVTMGTSTIAAPTRWVCVANDLTTGLNVATGAGLILQSAGTTTTATLSGITVSGDLINFSCSAY